MPIASFGRPRSALSLLFLGAALGATLAAGCTATGSRPFRRDSGMLPETDGGTPTGVCGPGVTEACQGTFRVECDGSGTETGRSNCADTGQVCIGAGRCATCLPDGFQCVGDTLQRCDSAGETWTDVMTCDSAGGQRCNAAFGRCTSLCDEAENSNSYIGCDYWPVTAANLVAEDFDFAVVVANPQDVPASITVERGGAAVASATVAPGATERINLPWVDALKSPEDASGVSRSGIVRNGAYHLTSTVPVTVYQFNPLEYRISRDCADETGPDRDGQCFAFSNDASLLLPTHVMTGNYIVASYRPLFMAFEGFISTDYVGAPGFFTVTAVDDAPVNVEITFNGRAAASADGTSVRNFLPGQVGNFSLNPGDVLQIMGEMPPNSCTGPNSDPHPADPFTTVHYCDLTQDWDLTGSEIRATGPVQVTGGHTCAFVPYYRWACDHLEESMFPLETWGTDFVVSVTEPLRSEPNLIRVISGKTNNTITFDPPVHSTVNLARGEMIEFEASQSFRVQGSEALMVAQFLVGQDYAGIGSSGEMGEGDPAFSLGIPTDQFRTSYSFLAPTTFTSSYVNVTAPSGSAVTLDGAPVTNFAPVGSSGHSVARVEISGGQHRIESSTPFGIVVYGFGSYTSYMYPGGLDLEEINVPF